MFRLTITYSKATGNTITTTSCFKSKASALKYADEIYQNYSNLVSERKIYSCSRSKWVEIDRYCIRSASVWKTSNTTYPDIKIKFGIMEI